MIARSRLQAGSRMEPTVDALPPQLDDEKWRLISDLFVDPAPDPAGGRPRANARRCFEGILWVLRSGARWKDLPKSFPSYVTCWRRFVAWSDQGLFDKAMRRLVDRLDRAGKIHHEQGFADGTFSSAKKGAIASVPLACYEKTDPGVMKVFSPFGKETIDEYEEAEATQSGADCGEVA